MKAIKKLIAAIRSIDGRRLAKATGIVLGFAFCIGLIIVIGKYAPGLLVAPVLALAIAALYWMLG